MKADADSPTRCQHQTASGNQCQDESATGQTHCHKHAMKQVGAYRFKRLFNRVAEMAESPSKGVAIEKSILQHQLEVITNSCETEADMMVNEHKMTNLAIQISKLALIDHKLAVAHGRMLDVETLSILLDSISKIIETFVPDKEIQRQIAEGINNAIEQATIDAAQKASDKIITE